MIKSSGEVSKITQGEDLEAYPLFEAFDTHAMKVGLGTLFKER